MIAYGIVTDMIITEGRNCTSSSFRSACCTPSPDTSRVMEGFSDLRDILSISSMYTMPCGQVIAMTDGIITDGFTTVIIITDGIVTDIIITNIIISGINVTKIL